MMIASTDDTAKNGAHHGPPVPDPLLDALDALGGPDDLRPSVTILAELEAGLAQLEAERGPAAAEAQRDQQFRERWAQIERLRASLRARGVSEIPALRKEIAAARSALGLPELRSRYGLADILIDRPMPASVCRAFEWEEGRPPMLIGPPGSGKTMIVQSAVLAMTLGLPLWGCPDFRSPRRPIRVLHVDLDFGRDKVLRRYKRLLRGMGVRATDAADARAQLLDLSGMPEIGEVVVDEGEGLRLISFEDLGRFRKAWAEALRGFDFAVIDSLRRLAPFLDENDSRFSNVPEALRSASEERHVPLLLLHHTAKARQDARGKPLPQTGRGSGSIDASAGSQLMIDDDTDNVRRLVHQRAGEMAKTAPFHLVFEDDPSVPGETLRGIRVVYRSAEQVQHEAGQAGRVATTACTSAALESLQRAGKSGLSLRGIRDAVREAGQSASNAAIDEATERLVGMGRALRSGTARRERYYAIEFAPQDPGQGVIPT